MHAFLRGPIPIFRSESLASRVVSTVANLVVQRESLSRNRGSHPPEIVTSTNRIGGFLNHPAEQPGAVVWSEVVPAYWA